MSVVRNRRLRRHSPRLTMAAMLILAASLGPLSQPGFCADDVGRQGRDQSGATAPDGNPREIAAPNVTADVGTHVPQNAAELKALEQKIRAVLQKVTPSVVAVSGGTAVVVSEAGDVLTVAHLGRQAGRSVTLTFPDGKRAKGKTLGNDEGVDAGMMKITDKGPWPHAEMGKSSEVKTGQWCLAVGYPVNAPRGKPPVVRLGRVLRVTSSAIITDCPIMGGDSGGPLFDLEGRVIAVSSRCDNSLASNLHVPVDQYRTNWERLAKGEDFNSRAPSLAYLGIMHDQVSEEPRIGTVFPDTAAAKAGLQAGDVLLRFRGKALQKYDQLIDYLRDCKPGDQVEIEVRRGDQTVTVKATLGKREE